MATYRTIVYQHPDPNIVRVVLNRPETRNAQDTRMLYELNGALDTAAQDDSVFKATSGMPVDPEFMKQTNAKA